MCQGTHRIPGIDIGYWSFGVSIGYIHLLIIIHCVVLIAFAHVERQRSENIQYAFMCKEGILLLALGILINIVSVLKL